MKNRTLEKMEENEVKKEEIEELEKIIKPEEVEVIEKTLKLQYSKQFFIRFPREFEDLLGLKKGKKIKFIIKIPPIHKEKKVEVRIEVIE